MAVLEAIESVLADDALSVDERSEQIEAMIGVVGWDAVCDSMVDLLADDRPPDDYYVAAVLLWAGVLDKREMPADRVIALLYHRFDPRGDREDNLAWSIAATLKGVGYLSDYKPLEDPGVMRELEAVRRAEG